MGLGMASIMLLFVSLKAMEACKYWFTETGKCVLRVGAWESGEVSLQRLR